VDQSDSAAISPLDYIRRSPLYRWQRQAGAVFEALANSAVVSSYGDPALEVRQAEELGLADLSPLARLGFKGAGAPDWIAAQGVSLPALPNQSRIHRSGALCARLSAQELLILGDIHGKSGLPRTLEKAWSRRTAVNTWFLPRRDSHCWFALTGSAATETLSKLCAIDLREQKFAAGAVAQTSLARSDAIVIRHDPGSHHGFYLLADLSLAEFLWEVLLDAMGEFGGKPVGTHALQQLADAT
jgi:sarcosine oxidase subunit gamma